MNERTAPLLYRGVDLIMRRAKSLILIIVIGGAAGLALSYLITPVFRAEAVLVPSDETLGLNQNSQLGGLGGLASLIGVGTSGSKENEALAILRSRALIYEYIKANALLPILFHDQWSPSANTWIMPNKAPTLEDGFIAFDNGIRTIVDNRKTGLIAISVTWRDPRLAKQWVDGLVNATNDLLRHEAIERSTKNLAYLQNASERTSIMEVKTTIYKLMEIEIKKQMAAIGNTDYAFRVVDPAVTPEHKSAPKRSMYAAIGGLLSGMTWFLVVVVSGRIRPETI